MDTLLKIKEMDPPYVFLCKLAALEDEIAEIKTSKPKQISSA